MKMKSALVSGLISVLCAVPAFAAHTTPAAHYVQHAAAAGFICGFSDNDLTDVTTTFANAGGHYRFNVYIPADSDCIAGLRLDCPTAQQAKSIQMDINFSNSNDPYFYLYVNNPGSGPQFWNETFLSDVPDDGFTAVNLRNGYTRYTYTAANDGLGHGSTFNSLYFTDFSNDNFDVSDSITNISVNGNAVLPILQAFPYSDCNSSIR